MKEVEIAANGKMSTVVKKKEAQLLVERRHL